MSQETKTNKQLCFACPFDLYEWLKNKGENEVRTVSNSIIHSLQIAKDLEDGKK